MFNRVTIDLGLSRSGSRIEDVCNLCDNGRLRGDGGRLRGRSTWVNRRNLPHIMAVAERRLTAGVAVSGCVAAVAIGAAAGAVLRAVAGEASGAAA